MTNRLGARVQHAEAKLVGSTNPVAEGVDRGVGSTDPIVDGTHPADDRLPSLDESAIKACYGTSQPIDGHALVAD